MKDPIGKRLERLRLIDETCEFYLRNYSSDEFYGGECATALVNQINELAVGEKIIKSADDSDKYLMWTDIEFVKDVQEIANSTRNTTRAVRTPSFVIGRPWDE